MAFSNYGHFKLSASMFEGSDVFGHSTGHIPIKQVKQIKGVELILVLSWHLVSEVQGNPDTSGVG